MCFISLLWYDGSIWINSATNLLILCSRLKYGWYHYHYFLVLLWYGGWSNWRYRYISSCNWCGTESYNAWFCVHHQYIISFLPPFFCFVCNSSLFTVEVLLTHWRSIIILQWHLMEASLQLEVMTLQSWCGKFPVVEAQKRECVTQIQSYPVKTMWLLKLPSIFFVGMMMWSHAYMLAWSLI